MTQKHKQNHVNVCHNRLHQETCNLFPGHHMEIDHGFMGMTQKWFSPVPAQQPVIFDPTKGNTNLCKKHTQSDIHWNKHYESDLKR